MIYLMKVYSAVKLPEETVEIIKNAGIDLEMHDHLTTPSEEEIIQKSQSVDGIISAVNVQIGDEIIDANKHLKIISNIGAGVNNIDLSRATDKGVVVTNTPGRDSVASTAEAAIGLMLATSRNIVKNQELVQNNEFNGWQVMGFLGGHQVSYKKIFIIGFGNIGQEIARLAKGFHMDIIYNDIKDPSEFAKIESELGVEYRTLDEGLKEADYVILQMNYTDKNHHLIGERELNLMKKDAYLINTARGGIVDEQALAAAIKEKKIAGAAIDVHEEEPTINSELIQLDNVVLTPHIGNDTYEARLEMANTAASEMVRVLKGENPKYQVR